VTVEGFVMSVFSRLSNPNGEINVYIEGDGFAWMSKNRLSDDPTPKRAVALQLAAADPSPNVIYLARPCQFNDFAHTPCSSAYWSNKRFSKEVIDAFDQVLDKVTKNSNGQKLNLIGYSGGAAIAVFLSLRRDDIASLRTIAGNLDHQYVNHYHEVDAMPESLNPIDFASKTRNIPQIHFIGDKDSVVPREVAERFRDRLSNSKCSRIIVVDADHQNNWVSQWRALLNTSLPC
jgi:dienelactone hydrolase